MDAANGKGIAFGIFMFYVMIVKKEVRNSSNQNFYFMHTKNTHHWTVVFCKVAITNATHVIHTYSKTLS